MYVSPTEAIKLYDVSKPTLYKDMSDGKISFDKDERGRRKLNVAELDRIYSKRAEEGAPLTSNNVQSTLSFTEPNVNSKLLLQEVKTIKEQIGQAKDREIKLLEQQIEQLREQNDNLNRYLKETREEHQGYLRLLEHKSTEEGTHSPQLDQKLEMMEQQMHFLQEQNELLLRREEERKRRAVIRKKKIEELKQQKALQKEQPAQNNKGLFERLFG
jgi:chromosome segregation ATPase